MNNLDLILEKDINLYKFLSCWNFSTIKEILTGYDKTSMKMKGFKWELTKYLDTAIMKLEIADVFKDLRCTSKYQSSLKWMHNGREVWTEINENSRKEIRWL